MIVISTGMSGSGRGKSVHKMADFAKSKGKDIEVIDVGKMMYEKSKSLGYNIRDGTILDTSERTLDYLRAIVFEDIIRKRDQFENIIVNTHACFRWEKHLTKAFNYYHLTELKPDLYITVTDTIYSIMARLEKTEWKRRNSLLELLTWRNEEEFITKTFARIQGKPHFTICRENPPETMYKIIFEKDVKKTYLSYPVSAGTPETMSEVQKVRDTLRKKLVVFDPMAIKDIEWLTAGLALKKQGKETIEIPYVDYDGEEKEMTFSIKDMENVDVYLKDQTINRDYSMISQSDFVTVYYYNPGIPSPGVQREIRYAKMDGKDVYIYYPKKEMSPFLEMDIRRHFIEKNEFIKFLENV